jgi:hypothetical protein
LAEKSSFQLAFGKQIALTLDIPECLIELKGGVEKVESTLQDGIRDGKKWMVLVTASGDKTSVAATERYYKAVSTACSPSSPKVIDSTEGQNSASVFDDDDDTSDQEYSDPDLTSYDFSEWKFAEMSFVGEPDLIWRWWIWK